MKKIEVVAAIIKNEKKVLATRRGYGDFIDMWEFPGGKMEAEESREAALQREILEELNVEVDVKEYLTTIDYDYPQFHLTMHCYLCSIQSGILHLNEHNDSKWVTKDTIDSLEWLPADLAILDIIKPLIS